MKLCPGCQTEKPLDAFYPAKNRKSGVRSRCKECERARREKDAGKQSAYFRDYYQRNKGELRERSDAYAAEHRDELATYNKAYRQDRRQNDPEAVILTRTRSRAKRKKLAFNLRRGDIQIPDVCPVLGIPIILGPAGRKGGTPNSPSIDRIDPTQGYVRGNVRVISNRANTLKNDATIEELEAVLNDLRRIKGVACASCRVLIHENTTGADVRTQDHLNKREFSYERPLREGEAP